jgi:hypothetical protein
MCEKTVHSLLEDMSDHKLDSIKAELIRIKQVFERMQEQNDNGMQLKNINKPLFIVEILVFSSLKFKVEVSFSYCLSKLFCHP